MKIYLTKPSGHTEGPYELEVINRQLAAKKFKDTDYWAWYPGLAEWVPLHAVPGVFGSDDTALWVLEGPAGGQPLVLTPQSSAAEITAPSDVAAAHAVGAAAALTTSTATPPPEPEATPALPERQLSSGLPFSALDQILILTTGEGPAASRSAVTLRMLEETVGQPAASIRETTPRAAIGNCAFIENLRANSAMPPSAWRVMANFKLQLVQDARAGLYKICVRSFPIETGDLVCLFLFYNKQKF